MQSWGDISMTTADWLRQRHPMLVIKNIIEYSKERIVFREKISRDEKSIFSTKAGEYTETLILEMLGQAAECLYRISAGDKNAAGFLVKIENAEFARRIQNNETLLIRAELDKIFSGYVSAKCRAEVEGETVASAHFTHYYNKRNGLCRDGFNG